MKPTDREVEKRAKRLLKAWDSDRSLTDLWTITARYVLRLLTSERRKWEKVLPRVCDALQDLMDVQNGPQLVRDKDFWNKAMDEAQVALDEAAKLARKESAK